MQGSGVGVLDKCMELTNSLSMSSGGLTALELARRTGMDRGTVHRLLKAMVYWKQVETADGTYRLGAGALLSASSYLTRLPLRRVALPYAIDLQNVISDRPAIVSVALPVGDQIVLIDRMWTATTPFNVIADLEDRFDMDSCTSGRAVLATFTPGAAAGLLGEERYLAVAPRLEKIRETGGYSFGHSEQRKGLSSMGYPVRHGDGSAIGALVVAGLEMETDMRASSSLAHHMQRACAGIAERLFNSSAV
ncbi:helix-turn-helix domain-containing protein [Gluconobacter sp. Dm-62]|uniref:IclR family transcriptional regulator n=1 Tax=Gluconobacter sp. Dm-62 TaxID=2799804 RepID=UPI001B8CA23C|nr:helix-turn-helix domain-containing protein [Gluconobacter sp. Dm-62]MBS1103495.1 helix-turn-helix domain-containing protein [Gluconobacter sp. Dm-62]